MDNPEGVPISELRKEEAAHRPGYIAKHGTLPSLDDGGNPGADAASAFEVIAKLPLETRYIWRLVSALKSGRLLVSTTSTLQLIAGRSKRDLTKVVSIIRIRPVQFSFLRALFCEDGMEQIMQGAVVAAKRALYHRVYKEATSLKPRANRSPATLTHAEAAHQCRRT